MYEMYTWIMFEMVMGSIDKGWSDFFVDKF